MTYIPDLSHWCYVKDWAKVKNNVDFMLSKATQGTSTVDSTLSSFISGCEKNKIHYWLYCFCNKGNEVQQVEYMIKTCKDKIGSYFVGYALDFESSNAVDDILQCIDCVGFNGEKCLVYGDSKNVLTAVKQRLSDDVGYWYPRYGVNRGQYDPTHPVPEENEPYVDLHQYTSVGTCEGLSSTACDLSRLTGRRKLSWFTTRKTAEFKPYKVKVTVIWHLNIRKEPNSSSSIVGYLNNDHQVTIRKVSNGWGYVDCYSDKDKKEVTGWIYLRYTKKL